MAVHKACLPWLGDLAGFVTKEDTARLVTAEMGMPIGLSRRDDDGTAGEPAAAGPGGVLGHGRRDRGDADRDRRARVGTFGVNLYVPDIGAPWGGRKASGMGSVCGPEGLQTYLATKCVFLPA